MKYGCFCPASARHSKYPSAAIEHRRLRVVNILELAGIMTVRDLVRQTYEDLAEAKNLGDKTIRDLREAVRKIGGDPPAWLPMSKRLFADW